MFWTIIIAVLVGAFIVCMDQSNAKSEELKQQGEDNQQKFNSLPDFNATKIIKGVKDTYIFGVDENSKKIAFVKKSSIEIVPFDQIISVEILEDNTILQQKSSLRTFGGAVVGGAIAGGAGAIVGGLSGDTKQNKKVSKVQIKIKLRDINHPSFTIDCFDCKTMILGGEPINPSDLDGYLYKQGFKDAQQIADTVGAIIEITDKTKKIVQTPTQPTKVIGSVADELSKLADLRSKGILTDEEFAAQKKALLGVSTQQPSVSGTNEPLHHETVVDNEVPQVVREALENGEKIKAVMLYKEIRGCGLAEAKKVVDSIS